MNLLVMQLKIKNLNLRMLDLVVLLNVVTLTFLVKLR